MLTCAGKLAKNKEENIELKQTANEHDKSGSVRVRWVVADCDGNDLRRRRVLC